MLTQERLKEVLKYDSKTGVFTWKIGKGNAIKGRIAGSLKPDGYIRINIDSTPYQSHRLAWLYHYGYMPENDIDHKDRVESHNWIDNLREVTMVCNCRNSKTPKNNKSGIKGVSSHKNGWVASIGIGGKTKHIIKCDSFAEAVCHRFAAEQHLGWATCDSASPAYKYVRTKIQYIEL